MLIGGRRIYYSRLNNPIVFPNNYYRSKFSSKKHHQQQRGMQEESGDKTPQNANNAGGNTKVNPKKLAKLEKFKAKEAKLKEQQLQQQQKAPQQKSVQKAKGKAEVAEYVEKTPVGQKKDMSSPMADSYNPRAVESAWYAWWEQAGFLKPRLREDGSVLERGTYVVPIPPPNVTGSLHLGHALTNSIQDALIRWHRMRGFTTLYLPGCDHAGIATQAVVEKMIWKTQKVTRHDLGREKFVERIWEWKEEYGSKIYGQLRTIGSSYDWSRVCFTMDPKFVVAVNEAFIRLHDEGTIYRDTRLVNWSCKLNTALSNLEVDSMELEGKTHLAVPGHDPNKKYEFGTIVSFAYPIEDSDEKIVVATTRLETMLGDTAVAVHPDDNRYKHLVGKFVVHPINGRRIPIIVDAELVDMSFGTGAVKITPAHDPNDYKVGKKHSLPFINVFNDSGSINSNGAPFEGLMRFDARVEVLKKLKELGLYVETKPNKMALPICSRSGDVIEPMLKPQWYIDCKGMASDALNAVKDGRLNIQPNTSEKEWFSWLENIQDWCISRQLWWGHRIPAYFVNICGQDNEKLDGKYWVSGRSLEEAQTKAYARFADISKDDITLEQDDDVLDTWFSASLWPFASFGWPAATTDFKSFYPNSLLETGWDILFFWVARMVMMGMKLTGEVPFAQVFCHAMVRDAHGRKMSKSLGNVIDPIDVIRGTTLERLHELLEKGNLDPKEIQKAKDGQKKDFPKGIPECGADALRFALCAYQGTNRDINLDVLRIEGYRKFCNKIWNAVKFALMKLGDDFVPDKSLRKSVSELSLPEKWILQRLAVTVDEVNSSFREYNFMSTTSAIHRFWLYELCDVYIELVKPVVDCDDGSVSDAVKRSYKETLYTCLDQGLRLMHPFMPYVTEELFQRLPRRAEECVETIMYAEFPENREIWKSSSSEEFEVINSVAKSARSLMADYGVKGNASIFVKTSSSQLLDLFTNEQMALSTLIFCKGLQLKIMKDEETIPSGCVFSVINNECNVHLMVKGSVDIDAEVQKLETRLDKCLKIHDQQTNRMKMEGYEIKVKEDVRLAELEKFKQTESEIEAIQHSISNFKALLL